MSNEKIFGRYHDLLHLLVGFLLTGIVGTYLAQTYTTRQANLAAAQKVFSDHSSLIGRRYFAMSQITNAYEDNRTTPEKWSQEEIQSRWAAYRSVLQEWNSSRGFNREMVRLYFGDALWNQERDIHYMFRAWGQSLEAEKNNGGAVDFACLDREVDELLTAMHAFQFQMAAAIQAGAVGPNRDGRNVKASPRADVMCLADGSSQSLMPSLGSADDGSR